MTTLSTIPQDLTTTRNLTPAEQRAELATARAIMAEALEVAGLDPAILAGVELKMTTRMTSSMGNARTTNLDTAKPLRGSIKLAASALWLHASPTKRRNTVVHELAHLVANWKAGRRVGHSKTWKRWMRALGEANPVRCHKVPKARPTSRPTRRAQAVEGLAMLIGRAAAEAHHRPRPLAAAAKFARGQVVLVGRPSGEKTRCRVVRVNGKSLTVETLEARAGSPAGGKMRASFGLCHPAE